MHINVLRENFLKAASLVGSVIDARPSLPVLSNFLLNTQGGFLEISATNLESTISYKIPVKVIKEGSTTVLARSLTDFSQTATGEQINLKLEKDNLMINSGSYTATLPTINPSEFPPTSQLQTDGVFEIEKSILLESIGEVIFNASPEEGRPILTGVLFSASKRKLDLVATDGYRLAKKELNFKGEFQIVIPSRALRDAGKALSEQEDTSIEIALDKEKNQIKLQTRNFFIMSRLLEGSYPNYDQIIPNAFPAEIQVGTKELANAIKLTSLFARDVGNVVRFEIGNKITITASTAQVGEAQAILEGKHKGDDLKIAFNSRFLMDCLSSLKSKETTISFSGITSAAVVRGNQDSSLMYVVMPVRIQS